MAYIQNQTDDQGQNQQNLTGQVVAQPNAPVALSSGGAQTPASAPASTPSMQQQVPEQKGSGRFTNLQKYVQANQGAGQRLATGAQKQIEKSLSPGKKQSEKQSGLLQQGLASGQQALTTGQKIQQEMAADTFTPQKAVEFTQGTGNVEQVAKMRTGQVVDEAALQKQKEAFEQATANLGQQVAQRGEQVGSETGRIGLLKETFGGKNKGNYTTGQSRLDNLLLQAGPGNLQALSQNIVGQQQNVQRLKEKAAAQGKTLEQVIADESALAKATQETTAANVEKFKTALGGQVEGFNKGIEERLTSGNQFLDFYNQKISDDAFKQKYGVSKKDYKLNQDLWNEFGLKTGQQTFNVFNTPDLNLGQVAEVEGRRAQDWRDVASQANVGEYAALAQLKGLTQPEYELNKATDINKAGYTAYDTANERSIQGRIKAAQDELLREAASGKLISGATQNVNDMSATGYISLADYLKNPDYWSRATAAGSGGSGNISGLEQFGKNLISTLEAPFKGLGQVASGDITGLAAPLGAVANLLGFGGGGRDDQNDWRYAMQRSIGTGLIDPSQGSFEGSATGKALQDYLASKGFSNYLTQGGVQQATGGLTDLAQQFGYRTNVQGEGVEQGRYNPYFERQKILESVGLTGAPTGQATTQVADVSGPMTAEQALAARVQATNPTLTREQIAQMAKTSTEAERAALRQELIGGGKYQTSQPEMQEIINRELASTDFLSPAKKELINRYAQSGAMPQSITDWATDFGGKNYTYQRPLTETEMAQYAQKYYTSSPDKLADFQSYLNQSVQSGQQAALDRAASQLYNTNINPALAKAPQLTTEQILQSLYQAPATPGYDFANMGKPGGF